MTNYKSSIVMILSIALPLAVGSLSAYLTKSNMMLFDTIIKPPLTPPGIVFPIAWTILYILMGIASGLVILSGKPTALSLILYVVQLVFNFYWSILFFNERNFSFAFVWLIGMHIFILVTTYHFYQIRPLAGYLMIPYIVWVTFAGYLNYMIAFLN